MHEMDKTKVRQAWGLYNRQQRLQQVAHACQQAATQAGGQPGGWAARVPRVGVPNRHEAVATLEVARVEVEQEVNLKALFHGLFRLPVAVGVPFKVADIRAQDIIMNHVAVLRIVRLLLRAHGMRGQLSREMLVGFLQCLQARCSLGVAQLPTHHAQQARPEQPAAAARSRAHTQPISVTQKNSRDQRKKDDVAVLAYLGGTPKRRTASARCSKQGNSCWHAVYHGSAAILSSAQSW